MIGFLFVTVYPFRSTRLLRAPTAFIRNALAILVLFRSTRLSRAPTISSKNKYLIDFISIHEALASPDIVRQPVQPIPASFDPRGSREPRPSEYPLSGCRICFDPRGSREPRRCQKRGNPEDYCFDPRGSREPRRYLEGWNTNRIRFRSTRLSRAPTFYDEAAGGWISSFDPRGSREPRRTHPVGAVTLYRFRSTRLSRAPTMVTTARAWSASCFDPRGSREPRLQLGRPVNVINQVSIHEALASPDDLSNLLYPARKVSIHEALASPDNVFTAYLP